MTQQHNESGVDLLVIVPTRNAIDQSVRIGEAFDWPFSLDLIVRTPKQIERGLKEGDLFLREVMDNGDVLYEASHGLVRTKDRTSTDNTSGSPQSNTNTAYLPCRDESILSIKKIVRERSWHTIQNCFTIIFPLVS